MHLRSLSRLCSEWWSHLYPTRYIVRVQCLHKNILEESWIWIIMIKKVYRWRPCMTLLAVITSCILNDIKVWAFPKKLVLERFPEGDRLHLIHVGTSVCIYYSEKPGKSGKVQFKSCRGTVGEKPYSWKLFIATLFVCTSYNRHIMQTLAGPVSPVLKILLWSSKHFHSMTWRNCNVGFKECRKQAKQEK